MSSYKGRNAEEEYKRRLSNYLASKNSTTGSSESNREDDYKAEYERRLSAYNASRGTTAESQEEEEEKVETTVDLPTPVKKKALIQSITAADEEPEFSAGRETGGGGRTSKLEEIADMTLAERLASAELGKQEAAQRALSDLLSGLAKVGKSGDSTLPLNNATQVINDIRDNPDAVQQAVEHGAEIDAEKQAEAKQMQEWANEHKAAASAASVVSSPLSMVDYLQQLVEINAVGHSIPSEELKPSEITQTLREGVSEDMGNVGKFLYNTAMSGVDSLVGGALGGGVPGVGGLILSGGAASSAMNDILQRGGSDQQAVIGGAAAGAFEAIFETVSIGQLSALKEMPVDSAKAFFTNMVKSIITNASEETATELANVLFDSFLMQDLSNYSLMVDELMAKGYNQSDAERLAKLELAKQVGLAGLAGGLMGAAFGGIGSLGGYLNNRTTDTEGAQLLQNALALKENGINETDTAPTQGEQYINEQDTTLTQGEQHINEPARLTNSQVEKMIRDSEEMERLGIDTNGKTMSQLRNEVRAVLAGQNQGAQETLEQGSVVIPVQETARTANPAASEAETRSRMAQGEAASAVLGENGAKAFKATYNEDVASQVDASTAYSAFTKVYNSALTGAKLTEADRAETASVPQSLIVAAESSARQDRLRAQQATYFGENAGLVKDSGYKKMHLSTKTTATLDAAAKVAGVQVKFVDNVEGGEASYKNGVIEISTKSKDPVVTLFTHEIVHRIRETSPQSYNAMASFVQQYMSETSKAVNAISYSITYDTADVSFYTEEMVADAFATMLQDGKAMERFVQDNRTVAQKVLDAIRDLINAIKRALNGQNVELSAEQRSAFRDLENQLSEMERVMESALKSIPAAENKNTAREDGVARLSTKNEVLALSSVDWMDNFSSIKDQLAKHADEITGMEPVAVVEYTPKTRRNLADQIMDVVASIGGTNMKNKGIGFAFDKEGIDKIDIHAKSDELRAASLASPYVAKYGKLIAGQKNHENKGLTTLTFAAPVVINGEKVNVGVAIQFQANGRPRAVNVGLQSGNAFKLDMTKAPKGPYSRVNRYGQGTSLPTLDAFKRSVTQPSPAVNPESGAEVVGDSVVRNSRRTWDDTDKNRLIRDLVNAGFAQDEVRKWIADVDSISAIIAADADRLDYTAAPHQKMLKNNAEYVTTLDASTLCSKRLLYQGTYDAIQHRLPNTALTPDDVIAIRKMMDEAGHEVPCGICYVESRRKSLGKFASEWLEGYRGEYIPKLEDVTTTDGLERLRVEHPDTYNDFIKAMNRKGTVNPKVVELRTEYREDIRTLTKGQVAKEIRIGGQRIQSFSDFETVHLIDMMQAVMDMAHVGLTAQAYTKVPNFAAVFGGTGIKINLSLIGDVDADGSLTFNPKEGMPIGQAMRLRNMYPENVGTILVGKNDAHILAAMADDRVDFIIPFHRSGWGSREYEQLGLTGYEDYTKQQNEKMLDGSATGGNLYPIDYWDYSRSGKENAEIYLSLCAEQGRIPKFSKFLVDNGDGSWSLQPDGSTDGYWKTLIDFKMYDNEGVGAPQQKVKPNFNMDEAYRVMSEYAGDADRLPVANDVVDRFVEEYQAAHPDTKHSKRIDPEVRREAEEAVARYVEQYGAIPAGENPARAIEVPRRTERNNKVSMTARTILEAEATPDELVPSIEKLVADGDLSYSPISDEAAVAEANAIIERVGWDQAQRDWFSDMKNGIVNKANTTMGWLLYNNAANSGNTKLALDILNGMVKSQRSAAQALQATRILKTLSPETQLYGVQKSVDGLTEELKKRYGSKAPDLTIDQALAEKFLNARTDKGRAEAMQEIYRDIGRQMPSRFLDKFNAWRYLAMLGNPRTHVRNIVGNLGFVPVVAAKNLTASAIELIALRNSDSRTKSVALATKEGRALLKAAWADYANVTEAMPDGKYSDLKNANKYIEEGRMIFGRGEGKTAVGRVLSNTAGKATEKVRRFNSGALAAEDMWFSKPHYASALAQYCKAHNITVEELQKGTSKRVGVARNYAMREAQKATYQDANAFSDFFSRLGRNPSGNKAARAMNALVEGVLPFRKTPANILVRSVEYSPIGLLKGISYDLIQVKKGKMTGAEAIDHISAGLTGTALLGLGIWMAAAGLVRGHGDEEKEKEQDFAELQGHQSYALELPDGTSVTLDWLAPEALPFFIGVNLWEMTNGMSEAPNMEDLLSAVSNVSEPLLEMSCLQGLNDLLDSVGYASSEGLAALPTVLVSASTSLLTQVVPTLLGQIERSSETVRMTTYTEKGKFLDSDTQYLLGKISAKIPGIDYDQIPYIDAWGRTESSGSPFERAFNNFLNPAYMSEVNVSAMEEELERLYAATGETTVLPSRASKSFTVNGEDINLTGKQYVEYATFRGQRAYDLITDLTQSKRYAGLTDAEKQKAVEKCYEVANEEAKALVSDFALGSFHSHMAGAEKVGISNADYIIFYKAVSAMSTIKDEKGNEVKNVASQVRDWLKNSGLTQKQKEYLWSTRYSSAY